MKLSTIANICLSGAGGMIFAAGMWGPGVLLVIAGISISLAFSKLEK